MKCAAHTKCRARHDSARVLAAGPQFGCDCGADFRRRNDIRCASLNYKFPPPACLRIPSLEGGVSPGSALPTLTTGIATLAKALQPSILIFAAEPSGTNDAADAAAAFAAGVLVPCAKPTTIADGLQGRRGPRHLLPSARDVERHLRHLAFED